MGINKQQRHTTMLFLKPERGSRDPPPIHTVIPHQSIQGGREQYSTLSTETIVNSAPTLSPPLYGSSATSPLTPLLDPASGEHASMDRSFATRHGRGRLVYYSFFFVCVSG